MTSSSAVMTSYREMLWSKKFAPPIFVIHIHQKYHFNHKINLDTKIVREVFLVTKVIVIYNNLGFRILILNTVNIRLVDNPVS